MEKYVRNPKISLNWSLKFFMEFIWGPVWQKNLFYSKQNCQNIPKSVFVKQPLRPKILQQKKNQPNKALVPNIKKTNRVDSKTLVQPWTKLKTMVWLETKAKQIIKQKTYQN